MAGGNAVKGLTVIEYGEGISCAFAAKVLIVRMHRFPTWALPLAGGLLFVALIGAWWTSSFWFFRQVGEGL